MNPELTELLAKATPVEIKDEAGWSLSLCFGHGDKGRDAMRQFCDTLIAQTKANAARIAALEAENERLRRSGKALLDEKHKEQAEAKLWFEKAQEWKAENERLREALGFYARPQSWRSSGVYMSGQSQPHAAQLDEGERARAALEQTP